jgi:Amt family ammonium transporter
VKLDIRIWEFLYPLPLAAGAYVFATQGLGAEVSAEAALIGVSVATGLGALLALRLERRAQTRTRAELLGRICDRLSTQAAAPLADDPDLAPLSEAVAAHRKQVLDARCRALRAEQQLHSTQARFDAELVAKTSALAASEESVRLLLESVAEGIYGVDNHGVCTFCNPACATLLGYRNEADLIGRPVQEFLPTSHWHLNGTDSAPRPVHVTEATFWRADGTLFPVEYWALPVHKEGQVMGTVVTFIDITQRKRAEIALFREKEHAQVTLNSIAEGVITTDAGGRVRYLNPVAEVLLDCVTVSVKGEPIDKVFRLETESGQDAPEAALGRAFEGATVRTSSNRPVLLVQSDGSRLHIEHTTSPIRDRDGSVIGYITVFRDVSEARQLHRQLRYQATHDALTGMINRREFEQRIERLLESFEGASPDAVLCFLDLDQFKVVNDTCGHGAGDELLRQIAEILRNYLRQRDTLARLGGDEFGILLEHCPLSEAFRVANSIREAVQEFRFAWDDKRFSIGVSIGLVDLQDTGRTLQDVLSAADAACYVAKEQGRNRVQIHHPEDSEVQARRGEIHWVSRINEAIANSRFLLYYQDIVESSAPPPRRLGRHLEVLVRIMDSEGRLALPGAFLPAAERYSVISATDRWVVREVFNWMVDGLGHRPELISVNLSGPTISDASFLDFVLKTMEETCIDPRRVCFEITETAAIAKLTNAVALISRLKQRGFLFALDDFGSGLSSFGYLKNLPVDFLKIDGSFIKDIVDDPIDRAMVRSINDLGHLMGKQTIAEYVEDEKILNVVRDLGVDFAQGYWISRPRPLSEYGRAQQLTG